MILELRLASDDRSPSPPARSISRFRLLRIFELTLASDDRSPSPPAMSTSRFNSLMILELRLASEDRSPSPPAMSTSRFSTLMILELRLASEDRSPSPPESSTVFPSVASRAGACAVVSFGGFAFVATAKLPISIQLNKTMKNAVSRKKRVRYIFSFVLELSRFLFAIKTLLYDISANGRPSFS